MKMTKLVLMSCQVAMTPIFLQTHQICCWIRVGKKCLVITIHDDKKSESSAEMKKKQKQIVRSVFVRESWSKATCEEDEEESETVKEDELEEQDDPEEPLEEEEHVDENKGNIFEEKNIVCWEIENNVNSDGNDVVDDNDDNY